MSKELIGVIKVNASSEVMEGSFENKDMFEDGVYTKEHASKTLTYIQNGRKVICIFECGDIKVKGVARCNPEDIFNLSDGMSIAEFRARQAYLKEIEKRYIEDVCCNPLEQLMKALTQAMGY